MTEKLVRIGCFAVSTALIAMGFDFFVGRVDSSWFTGLFFGFAIAVITS